jgi:hypothetical protein
MNVLVTVDTAADLRQVIVEPKVMAHESFIGALKLKLATALAYLYYFVADDAVPPAIHLHPAEHLPAAK